MKAKLTPFSAFDLSEAELIVARTLTPEAEAYYQTLMADAAAEKIVLEPDAIKIMPFIQKEAYLRGQIDILNMLLGSMTARPTAEEAVPTPEEPKQPQS